jgi:hypothetical protein
LGDVQVGQPATIHRLAAEFVSDLEARGFQRSQIANALTALGINLAATCNDPDAFALVIEAALREMNPHNKKQIDRLDGVVAMEKDAD